MNETRNRLLLLAAGAALALLMIGVLSVLLPQGPIAKRLLDMPMAGEHRTLPYPLTIQNLMTLLLGIGLGDVLHRRARARRENDAVDAELLPEGAQDVIGPADMGRLRARLSTVTAQPPTYLVRLVDQCILYFSANEAPGQTHQVLTSMTDLEMHDVDLRYTLLRYLAWVIPTIGFIGTVLGIAEALGVLNGADMATAMDAVIGNLAMAFDTTLVALCYSAVLVLLVQFTQKSEEESINRSATYCLKNFINRLYVPGTTRR